MFDELIVIAIILVALMGIMIFFGIKGEQKREIECQGDCKGLDWEFWRYKDEACYCLKDGEPRHIWGDDANFVPIFIPMSTN